MSTDSQRNGRAAPQSPHRYAPAPSGLLTWHRRMGLASGLFLLFFILSGLPLHYTDALDLGGRQVGWGPLLDWYGIEAPEAIVTYATDAGAVSLVGERLYLNRRHISGHYETLTGATAFAHGIAVAVDGGLLLLTNDGEVIEYLNVLEALGGAVRRLAPRADGGLVAGNAGHAVASGPDGLRWREWASKGEIQWALPSPTNAALESDLRRQYRRGQLSWERLLLDLHSGRLFGPWGAMVMDGAAIALAFLVLSGFWFWYRPRRGPPNYTDARR